MAGYAEADGLNLYGTMLEDDLADLSGLMMEALGPMSFVVRSDGVNEDSVQLEVSLVDGEAKIKRFLVPLERGGVMGTPLIDVNLNEFNGEVQTRFAISPFGNSETRAERIARWEQAGVVDPDCAGCKEKYDHPRLDPFAPNHRPSPYCRSGGRAHCTCDSCF